MIRSSVETRESWRVASVSLLAMACSFGALGSLWLSSFGRSRQAPLAHRARLPGSQARRSGSGTMKVADGAAFTITQRSASQPTDSWSPSGRRFPPQELALPRSSKRLEFPPVTDLRRRRSGPNVTSPTRSPPCTEESPSPSPEASKDVLAAHVKTTQYGQRAWDTVVVDATLFISGLKRCRDTRPIPLFFEEDRVRKLYKLTQSSLTS